MMSRDKFQSVDDGYVETVHRLARQGVPNEPTEEALLDIVRSSLQIAREAFRRIEGKRPDLRE